ncbi:unnamed protein product [Danaus chrysippus]|uniref:(African queen) hypothetical protein n=1 Tax=Danaus chrysippus TaxID=151541 RepID=A0A8J2RI69_9NEOP|nr:unnamed protein product [Danaus chrysippus]
MINSRPLIEIDDHNEESLTPNHFLIGRSCGAPTMGTFKEDEVKGRKWKAAQHLADHFWARWIKEYLPTLVPRRIGGGADTADLQQGDVVIIVDSTLPRNSWPRGEVMRVYPGPDGRTRVVDVRTSTGLLKRPSSKIIRLVSQPTIENKIIEQRHGGPEQHRVAGQEDGAKHEGEDVGDATDV